MGEALDTVVRLKLEEARASDSLIWPSPRYRNDATAFALDVIGQAPTKRQAELFEAVRDHERVAVPKGRKTGGSSALATLALCHYCSHEDATVVVCAPSERQIAEIVFFDLIAQFHGSGRCLVCKMREPNGPRPCPHSAPIDGVLSASVRTGLRSGRRRIIGLAPRNAEHARGISGPNQLWLIDEASGVSRDIFEAADGNRAAGAKLVVAGQPTSRATWFYDAVEKFGFHVVRMASTDSPNVVLGRRVVPGLADRPWIDEKRADWGGEDDPRFQVEVLGMFPSREGLRLVSDEELGRAFERHEAVADKLDAVTEGELFVGIDPAGGRGADKSAMRIRRGGIVLATRVFDGATDQIMGELDVMLRRWRKWAAEPVTVNFDASSSFGADLHDALRKRRLTDEGLRAVPCEMRGNRRTDPMLREARCARLVDAYYLNLSIRLRSDAAIPFDEAFRQEAIFAEFREDQEDGTKLISKREYRKALGKSPDLLDATALCFWEGRVAPASTAARQYRAELEKPLPPPPPGPRTQREALDQLQRGGAMSIYDAVPGGRGWSTPPRRGGGGGGDQGGGNGSRLIG